MPDDVELAKSGHFPVILGGHDHGVFHEIHGGCHVVKAGEDAYNVVCVDLVWPAGASHDTKPEVSTKFVPLGTPKKAKREVILEYEPDPSMVEVMTKWQAPARELKTATLAQFPAGLLSSVDVRAGPSSMAGQIASALRECTKADGALIQSGGVRGKKVYETGLITYADLSAECPFPSSNVVITVTGQVLKEAVAESRRPWAKGDADGGAFQVDLDMHMDSAGFLCEIAGKPLDMDALYDILVDSYMLGVNPVLKAYAAAHPERIPPDDAGGPVLPLLVKYFCRMAWRKLVDYDNNGTIDESEVDRLFDAADADGSGFLDEEEVFKALAARLGNVASKVLGKQMLNMVDLNSDGKVTRSELRQSLLDSVLDHVPGTRLLTHKP